MIETNLKVWESLGVQSETEFTQRLCRAIKATLSSDEKLMEHMLWLDQQASYYLLLCGDGIKRDGDQLGILK